MTPSPRAQRKLMIVACAGCAVLEAALVPLIGTHLIVALSTLPGLGWAAWYLHTHPDQVEANIATMSRRTDFGESAQTAKKVVADVLEARRTIGDDMAPSSRLKSHARNEAAELDLDVDFIRTVEGSTIDIDAEVVTWYAMLITGRGSYRAKVEIPTKHLPGTVDQAWINAFKTLGIDLRPPWRKVADGGES